MLNCRSLYFTLYTFSYILFDINNKSIQKYKKKKIEILRRAPICLEIDSVFSKHHFVIFHMKFK